MTDMNENKVLATATEDEIKILGDLIRLFQALPDRRARKSTISYLKDRFVTNPRAKDES